MKGEFKKVYLNLRASEEFKKFQQKPNMASQLCKDYIRKLNEMKEMLVTAYLAEVGYLPSETVIVEQETPTGRRISVEKSEERETIKTFAVEMANELLRIDRILDNNDAWWLDVDMDILSHCAKFLEENKDDI